MDRYLEALLFVSEGPVGLDDLARALQVSREEVEQAIERLLSASAGRGTHLVYAGQRVQMVTAPDAAPYVERFLGLNLASKLSSAALETLAIIAYHQPITRAQIDAVRGVSSDGVIRSLVAKALVAPMGRLEQVGRPVLLGTTLEFLQYFGIHSLDDLPSLPELVNVPDRMVALDPAADPPAANGHADPNGSNG